MRRSADFSSVVRRGARAGGPRLVVHHDPSLPGATDGTRPDTAALVGFVVSRSVGGSVLRHRVTRRLRAQLAARLGALPAGSGTVVRALPEAASASSAQVGTDLDRALLRVVAGS